jgi:hypothetical protein
VEEFGGWLAAAAGITRVINRKSGQLGCPPERLRRWIGGHGKPCPYKLLEFFGHYGELQFSFGQGLDYRGFGVFCGSVARGGHFADQ